MSLILALLVGITLGLLGGGGSILTVPILIYVEGMDPKLAIGFGLGVVGIVAFLGAYRHHRSGNIDWSVLKVFVPVSMLGAYLGAFGSRWIPGTVQLTAFAIAMVVASVMMFRGRSDRTKAARQGLLSMSLTSLFVGVFTGIVGVGGGFMIVPALVLLAGLSMHRAVGTSLFVIGSNSAAGLLGYLQQISIPWSYFAMFSGCAAVGIFIGGHFADKVPARVLKKVFAVFLLFMGAAILYQNRLVFT